MAQGIYRVRTSTKGLSHQATPCSLERSGTSRNTDRKIHLVMMMDFLEIDGVVYSEACCGPISAVRDNRSERIPPPVRGSGASSLTAAGMA